MVSDPVTGFHAHVYFDAQSRDRARKVCEAARDTLGVAMGRIHEKPVGPHPDWSCQLSFGLDQAGPVISWLALNRDGLVVFIHPQTGDDMADHTRHAIWLGGIRELDTTIFEG